MIIRNRPPNRRQNATREVVWGEDHPQAFSVTVGFDPATGRPCEVFAGEAKGDMLAIIADACVLISVALQHGISATDLAHSLAVVPARRGDGDAPASPIGAIVETVIAEVQP